MAILIETKTAESIKNKWGTDPRCFSDAQQLFRQYTGKELVLDVAAEPQTAKASRYYLPPDWVQGRIDNYQALSNNNLPNDERAYCVGFDGLLCEWENGWWCNPPFDRKLEFIEKATEQMFLGRDGMMLLPYEPLSVWWREHIDGYASVIFEPDGRYQFYEANGYTRKSGANFGSVLVLWTRRKIETPRRTFNKYIKTA